MTPYTAIQIQRFDDLYDSTPTATLTLAMALEEILTGTYRTAVERCRHILASRGKDAYTTAKSHLPQWTFAGTFAPTRNLNNLVQHSGIVHADIDHLASLPETKRALMRDAHVLYCFTSPAGDGLKYGVRIPVVTSDTEYKHAWSILAAAHRDAYKVIWDSSGKDICRLCYVSFDPTCYVNPDADVYPVPPPMIIPQPKPRPLTTTPISSERREWYAQRGIASAVKIIEDSVEGGLHAARCRAAYLLGGYVGGGMLTYADAYTALEAVVQGHTKHFGLAMKTIAACLKAGEAEPITLEEKEYDWQQWKTAQPLRSRTRALASTLNPRLATTLRRRLA